MPFHERLAADYEADPRGAAIEFRKHLGWYVKGLPNSADLRRRLHAVNAFDEVEAIFDEYLRSGLHFEQVPAEPEGLEMQAAEA